MHPVLWTLGELPVRTYSVALAVSFLVGWLVRRSETRRLGYRALPGHRWVAVGALVGAMIGAKLGMVLFHPPGEVGTIFAAMLDLDFTGKTVVGGLAGGYIGVEVAKKLVGITASTGDAFALALPLAQAMGRVGCFFNGCCYGTPWDGPWSVELAGVARHPTPLYEALGLLLLAGWVFTTRAHPRPRGHLFRRYLVGYALLRFSLEPFRGDAQILWGPLTAVQWAMIAAAVGFTWAMVHDTRSVPARA